MTSRRAFTLLELLVVIGVIAVLAGMLLAGLSMLQRSQRAATARQEVQALVAAVMLYHVHYGRFGAATDVDGNDARTSPLRFLRAPESTNKPTPWFTLSPAMIPRAVTEAGGRADQDTVDNLLDPFGKPYRFWIRNAASRSGGPIDHTERIMVISGMAREGTQDDFAIEIVKGLAAPRQVPVDEIPEP